MLALKNITPQNTASEELEAKRNMMASSGIGGYPFVGTPDKVAADFADMGRAGFRGLAVSFVNYLQDAPYFCAEILPRLARMGFRAAKSSA
jgi:alkanesulfonate monooxygenase SsuD/methylene tetrahydromethanopterin reductase-like flavin-dependent oxidoreductase (luciferase family)